MNNTFQIKLDLTDNDIENSKKNKKVENSILDEISNLFNSSIDNDSQKMLMLSIVSHLFINSMKKN
jgi:hypothetical protein